MYSPTLGGIAEGLAARGVSVIDDLRKLAETPDIVHAHHCIPCGEALIRFPQVPAIFVCHAFDFWMEAPVHFPQIGAYVAVDEACRDRLVHKEGIDPKRVVVLYNAVDLTRIPPRPHRLRDRPQRALAFGKASTVPELRAACEQLGIEYHALDLAAGRMSAEPEQELVNFDLVFGTARAALEALCCGCAVIVCDRRGLAGYVTSRNFATLRAMNFGLRSLDEAVTVERCVHEIGRYDSADALLVAEQARKQASLEQLLDSFEKLYSEVLTGARRPQMVANAHESAVTRFLHENLPRKPRDGRWPWMADRDNLQTQIQSLEATVVSLSDQIAAMDRDRIETRRTLETSLAGAQDHLTSVMHEHDITRRKLEARLSEFQERLANVTHERDATKCELEAHLGEVQEQLAKVMHEDEATRRELEARLSEVQERLANVTHERDETRRELEARVAEVQGRLANVTHERDETRRELEARLIKFQKRLASEIHERDATKRELEIRLSEAHDHWVKATHECDKIRYELQARLKAVQGHLAKNTQERDEIRHALRTQRIEADASFAKLAGQHEETSRALNNALTELTVLKRSRLLKLGRRLRRIAGFPVPY